MSTGFFKSNEKVIMTLLLLILAPTFAATGLVESFFTAANSEAYVVFGETVDVDTFVKTRRSLSEALWVNNIRRFGPYAANNLRRFQSATVDDVLRHMVFVHDLNERGIEPSMERKKEEIREAALDLIAWHKTMEQAGWTGTYQDRFPDYNALRTDPNFRFTRAEYEAVFKDENFGLFNKSLTIGEFEDCVIRNLRTQELLDVVTSSVAVSEQEVFNDFSATYEKRILDIVQVPGETYIDEARDSVTIEDFENHYNENSEDFVLQNRLSVEVARVNRNNLIASIEYEPTVEEIEAKYAEDRDILYRIRRPEGYVPPEDGSPEDEYRPLPEVFERVVRSIKQAKAQELEGELLQSALDALKEFRAQGEEVELSQVFPENLEYVEITEVEPFTQRELSQVDAPLRNPAAYSDFFTRERLTPGSVVPGDLYESIATNSQGNFIIRVKEMLPQRQMTYDEAVEDVIKATEEAKAKSLAAAAVEGWVSEISAEDSEASLQSVAEDNNFTVNTLEPLTRTQSFNVRINGNSVPSARDLLTEAFDIQEVGGVIGPVTSDNDKAVYMVRLGGMGDADIELFETLKETTERRLLLDKQRALLDAYEAELMTRANIQQFLEEGESVSREELLNQELETDSESENEATSG
ncbi:MAG: hypothetical protein CBC13_11560 [Planctomycetia bacterium TMED53]|nr:MAG: hypothetical protein CBC13_11560 [Planctomycetia bacterium TMED53]